MTAKDLITFVKAMSKDNPDVQIAISVGDEDHQSDAVAVRMVFEGDPSSPLRRIVIADNHMKRHGPMEEPNVRHNG